MGTPGHLASDRTVALLGGESSGKSWLAAQLVDTLAATGHGAVGVSEWLRHWCDAHGRTPQAHEQAGVAWRQALRIRRAQTAVLATHAQRPAWVVADTTPLMTAAYSEHCFGDTRLYAAALAFQRRHCGLTLLMGLDLPWAADAGQRDGPDHRAAVDRLLRRALDGAGLPYQVVYGQGPQRLQRALEALGIDTAAPALTPTGAPAPTPSTEPARRGWRCLDCLDPVCEHRLFGDLLGPQPSA